MLPINRRALAVSAAALAFIAAAGSSLAQSPDATAKAKQLLDAAPAHGERSLGDPNAPVVLIEYASATCPHCAEFHEKVLTQIRSDYIDKGKVRFIFREFPLDNTAMAAFMLARCVPEDKFFPTIEVMFKRQKTWMSNPKDELLRVMQLAGMDQAGFDACLKRGDLAKAIYDSSKKASTDFGVKGTPAIFINGTQVDGHKEYAEIKAVIDAELAK